MIVQMEDHYREMATVLQLNDIVRFRGFQENPIADAPESLLDDISAGRFDPRLVRAGLGDRD
jgi:hypothetical protein